MESPLYKSLRLYFIQLATTHDKSNELLKSIKRPLEALKNQSEQFRHVTSKEVDDAEIFKIDGVRDNLIYKINVGIEDEISQILNVLHRIKVLVKELKIKLERLEIERSEASEEEPSFKELVDGTSHRPRINLMLEWAIESSRYYSEFCDNIFEKFKILDYKNSESIKNWNNSFEFNREKKQRIESILGFTQFFIKQS